MPTPYGRALHLAIETSCVLRLHRERGFDPSLAIMHQAQGPVSRWAFVVSEARKLRPIDCQRRESRSRAGPVQGHYSASAVPTLITALALRYGFNE